MSNIVSTFRRDANHVPIVYPGFQNTKTIAFTGASGAGATGTITLFSVTGTVAVNVFAICTKNLASSGGTVEIGIAASTAALCNQQTATDVDNNEVWTGSTLAIAGAINNQYRPVTQDIILTIAGADVTDGTLEIYCWWLPESEDANLTTP